MTDVVGESVVEQRGIQGALDWLGQLDKKQVNMQSAYNSVIKRAIPRSSSSLAEWINRNPDNNHIQPWMYSETAKRIASRDPGLPQAGWNPTLPIRKSTDRWWGRWPFLRWVESDPKAAASWVDSLKGTRVYDKELTKRLGGAWARKDPEAPSVGQGAGDRSLAACLLRASLVICPESNCWKTHPGSRKAPPAPTTGFGRPMR